MKRLTLALVLLGVLATPFVPAVAQGPRTGPGSGPEEERMTRMQTMMGDMQDRMKQMQEQMKGMMQQHRAEMQKHCPGAATPDSPKHGG